MNKYKERPARLYADKNIYYIYKGGKKHRIISDKKTKREIQRDILDKIKMKISNIYTKVQPAKVLKLEHLQSVSSLKSPEDLDEYLIALRKNNPKAYKIYLESKALSKKTLNAEEKTALNVLEARTQEENAENAKDTLIAEIKAANDELKQQALELSNERKLLNEQTLRDEKLIEEFKKLDIDYTYFPFRSWNGLNNGKLTEAAFKNQLLPFIRNLLKLTPYEIIDNILAASGINMPLTNKETPPDRKDYQAITRDELNVDNVLDTDDIKKIKNSLREKRLLITQKLLTFLTPKIFNMIISRISFPRYGLRDVRPIFDIRQIGKGANTNLPALYNDEIEEFFSDENKYPNFGGVISADQISSLPKKLPIGFIMNLDKHDEPGSHWVAVYISGDSVEYFDPLANPPSKEFIRDIKKYIEDMKIPILMKFKINKIAQQHGNSSRCGFHAIRFLDDRFAGTPYKWSTRYINNSKNGEDAVKKEFEYI